MKPDALFQAYRQHKTNAGTRGVEWHFDFDSWLSVWHQSGKLHLRGKGKDRYCMSRPGDVGPYAPWNVRIVLFGDNVREAIDIRRAARIPTLRPAAPELEEKDSFFEQHGITVLDWLKSAIDWHVRATPVRLMLGEPLRWPELINTEGAPAVPEKQAA